MSNGGEYKDSADKTKRICGTSVRVDKLLREAASRYQDKNIYVIFNDLDAGKIEHLRTLVSDGENNYHVQFYNEDCNRLLHDLQGKICGVQGTHYLLVYDPYEASIDWNAVTPFLNNWGEVIINHMLFDSIRAVQAAKRPETVSKYETTYQTKFMELVTWGSDRKTYESCIQSIIHSLCSQRKREFFIASFPFFNSRNALMYDLIHCTSSLHGFRLFKQKAWQVFGGSSSNKNTHGEERQGLFAFPDDAQNIPEDEYCYHIDDIARYVQMKIRGRNDVSAEEIRDLLDRHPIFPSEGFLLEIKRLLKRNYGASESHHKMSFSGRA